MAENKKGFILYADLIHTVEKMSANKAGLLFKHILRYVNDQDPKSNDLLITLLFEPIKQQLKRDLTKWETKQNQRSVAGKKSAEKRKNTPQKPALTPYKKVDNKAFIIICANDAQWIESVAMKNRLKVDIIKSNLDDFEQHLVSIGDTKPNLKEFKSHFTNWLNKKPTGKGKKINYYS